MFKVLKFKIAVEANKQELNAEQYFNGYEKLFLVLDFDVVDQLRENEVRENYDKYFASHKAFPRNHIDLAI
jgi:hypothetical protein